MGEETEAASTAKIEELSITVVYDNNPHAEGLETDWGFAAHIAGAEKTLLFDTGGDGPRLLNNMYKLGIDPNTVDVVVLSHIHADHTGGLMDFLKRNSDIVVYLPKSFPSKFKTGVRDQAAQVLEVEQPVKICDGVYSAGQLGTLMREQSLAVRAERGLIVVTGCAHPGIVKVLYAARDFLHDEVLLVMGGFHLEWATKGKIEKVISRFERAGVRYVGPCHCSGHKARSLFEKHYDKGYIKIGVGKVITLADLQ